MAVAHSMLIAIYFVLLGNEFNDLGADYYIQFNREKKINSHVRQLSKLGVTIPDYIPRAAAPQPPDGQDLADTTSFKANRVSNKSMVWQCLINLGISWFLSLHPRYFLASFVELRPLT